MTLIEAINFLIEELKKINSNHPRLVWLVESQKFVEEHIADDEGFNAGLDLRDTLIDLTGMIP